jgi:ABC-2 type transport system permease protein
MKRVALALWNPIVAKEYRSRMRTWRSPVAMSVYILLLGGLGWAIFSGMAASSRGAYNSSQASNYGQGLFLYLILFQMVLLAFITPALTAGAISGERERQTIDLLFVTKIPAFSIIWGKLLASMSFVLLLLLLSVPIFSLVFLFGGIELDQVLEAFAVTTMAALTLGIIGIACSTAFRRTLAATVSAYGAAFVLLAGSLLFGLLFPTEPDPSGRTAAAPPAITYLSPALPLITIATNQPVGSYGIRYGNGTPYATGSDGVSCAVAPDGGQTCYPIGPGKASPIVNPPQASGTRIPSGLFAGWQYWQATAALQLAVSLVALVLSAVLLPPIRRLPWRRRPQVTAPAR